MSNTTETVTIVIGATEYRVAPLTVGGLSDLAQWVKEAPVRDAVRLCKEAGMDKSDSSAIISRAYDAVAQDKRTSGQVYNEEIMGHAHTSVNAMRMLWECMRECNEKLSFQAVLRWELDDIEHALEALAKANGFEAPASETEAEIIAVPPVE